MRALEVFKAISAGDLLFLRILPEDEGFLRRNEHFVARRQQSSQVGKLHFPTRLHWNLRHLTSSGICPFLDIRVIQRVTQKRANILLAKHAKRNRGYLRAADHRTRFFNVPDFTSSVKRRLSAQARRRFFRSADRRPSGQRNLRDNFELLNRQLRLDHPASAWTQLAYSGSKGP
jgi:hypothetical protein